MSDMQHIVCPACATLNRVPRDKAAGAGRCGRCHSALFTHAPVEVDDDTFDKHVRGTEIPVVPLNESAWKPGVPRITAVAS